MQDRWYWRARCGSLVMSTAIALACLAHSPAQAKDAQPYLDTARAYALKGNLKAAEIELRNAERAAPTDAHIRAFSAQVYFGLGDMVMAEREARAARELKAPDEDYLMLLAEAMLRQGKYADIPAEIKPGDRSPALESKVRVVLATAAMDLHDQVKAEKLLREAVSLDETAPGPKIALARQLLGSDLGEADKLTDQLLAADPRMAEAIAMKGEILGMRGDLDGAMQRFGEALSIDPNDATAHLARANANLSRGDYAAVDKDLDAVLKASPQNFAANYLRALELFKKRDYAAADKILDRISPNFSYMAEGLYVQAATKYGLGQYQQAADAIGKFIARVPQSPFGARLAAMMAMKRNAPDIALKYLKDYLAKYPPDAATLTLLGNVYVAMRQSALALEQYEKAASLEPADPTLKTLVAATEIDAGAGRKGLNELEEVFATDAGLTTAGPTLAFTQLRAGRADEAAATAEKLVQRSGENPLYQTLLGLARIGQKNYSAAEAIFKNLTAKYPDYAPARTNLANTYVAAGQIDDAKKVYQDFLTHKPNDVPSLMGLAGMAVRASQWDEAIGYAEKASAGAGADPAPGLMLLNLYVQRHDWGRAIPLARDLSAQFPDNADIFEAQGRVLALSGDQANAIEAYRRAYEIAPNSALIVGRYAALLAAANRMPELRTLLQARAEKDPGSGRIKEELIRIEAQIGGLDAGIAKASSYAKNDPENSLYDLVAADLYEKFGKRPEGVALLEKLAASHPADDSVAIALAKQYGRAGEPAKAEAVLSKRLKDRPDDLALRGALVDFYIATKKFDAAIAEAERLLAARENDPAALNNLAWLYQQQGDLTKAREFAEKASTAAPTNGEIEDTLGWVLLAQGDNEKALSHLEKASAAVPQDLNVQYHVAVALGRAGRPADARAVLEKLLGSGASFTSKEDAQKLLDELKRG
jgi:putative PEP-CTERM system TPR-repeat lipoprotein